MINQGSTWFPSLLQVHDGDTPVAVTAHLRVQEGPAHSSAVPPALTALTACCCPPPLSPGALEWEGRAAAPSPANQSGNNLIAESKALPAVFCDRSSSRVPWLSSALGSPRLLQLAPGRGCASWLWIPGLLWIPSGAGAGAPGRVLHSCSDL